MPRSRPPDPACAIDQALNVVGDTWTLLILRDVARGISRFDQLVAELGLSRKLLTERLYHLVAHDVLVRRPYQQAPTRYDYLLTRRGEALLPMLVALQDWGDRWVLGDGELTGASSTRSAEAQRLRALVGAYVPSPLRLPSTGGDADVVDQDARATVVFTYPATGIPGPLPEGWDRIPGTTGCTLENRLFRDRYPAFTDAGVAIHGVSTQRPDEQRRFAELEKIPFRLLSDEDLHLAAALRLPTFRVAEALRLKRSVLIVGADRTVHAVRFPVTDIPDAISWALTRATALTRRRPARVGGGHWSP
ncbi:MAG TPA: winged helix-turn-helix transcriptional regulator [Jatrophihabitantaceae bacterium]|jgi:DNA-binding HxlR family transcriptional regulator/peroxiredoxin